jgi:hypothetical protein
LCGVSAAAQARHTAAAVEPAAQTTALVVSQMDCAELDAAEDAPKHLTNQTHREEFFASYGIEVCIFNSFSPELLGPVHYFLQVRRTLWPSTNSTLRVANVQPRSFEHLRQRLRYAFDDCIFCMSSLRGSL